jgi:hypothetical protein
MRVSNRFIDPKTAEVYDWPINHEAEQNGGRSRAVDSSQNIDGTRTIQSQGELEPLKFTFTGTILDQAQHDALWAWVAKCETQTIHLRDFAGDEYEGIIDTFQPIRVRVAQNPRQPTKPWKWTYTMSFTVVKVVSGALAGQPA